MTTIFTSDTHFGHANVIKYCDRPYASAEEMDAALIKNWNAKIQPKDTVWHLGDVAFAPKERTCEILSQLNGRKNLVLGNHDRRFKNDPELRSFFESIHDGFVEMNIGKTSFFLCHYPMLSWNKSFHGSIHLHGHCHGKVKYDTNILRLDVGVDAYGPIETNEIISMLTK